jgi:hypothetical protein
MRPPDTDDVRREGQVLGVSPRPPLLPEHLTRAKIPDAALNSSRLMPPVAQMVHLGGATRI